MFALVRFSRGMTPVADILLIICLSLFIAFFGWMVFELSNQIEHWRRKYNLLSIQLKGRDESILRLDLMLLEALDGQLELLKFIENFSAFMSPKNREIIHDWKIKIQRTKEVYVERWRESDESRANSSNVNGKLGETPKQ